MRRTTSIRTQLMGLVAAIAVPLGAMEVLSLYEDYRGELRHAEMGALYLAEGTAASVNQYLVDARSVAVSLADWMGEGGFERACGALRAANEVITHFEGLVVVDVEGNLRCSSDPVETVDATTYSGALWFRNALETGEPGLGALSQDRRTGTRAATMGFPLRDDSGRLIGAVGGSLDPPRFHQLLASMELPPEAVITVLDNRGTVVARTGPATPSVSDARTSDPVPGPAAPARTLTRTAAVDGVDRIWGTIVLDGSGWRVSAGLATDAIYGPLRAAALRKALGSVTLLAFVVALALSLYRRIDSALQALVRRTREAGHGGGYARPTEGPLEVLEVGEQFDRALAARSRAEASERQAKVRYRSILENAVFGIYVSTPDGRFLEVNPALAEMLGYPSREALRDVNLADLYADPEERRELVEQHREADMIDHVEVEWKRLDGSSIFVRLNGNIVHDPDSGEPAFEVIVEDITEQRALEKQYRQTQRMEAIGRLAGGVAHDFNNLLTVMIGQTEILLSELPLDSPLRDSARAVVEAGERASGLTRQLLAFSRKEVRRPGLLDVNRVVGDLERMLVRLIGEDVILETDLAPGLPPVLADAGQMEQVVMNLVVNARDALPAGGRIRIETRSVSLDEGAARGHVGIQPGSYVRLRVADDGVGMSPDVQAQVFEPFFTTKPPGLGTGLGLATVYGIATQSGGDVTLRSEVGAGSTFDVLLPARQGPVELDASDITQRSRNGNGRTVLVVEDEAPVRAVVRRVLERAGYAVLVAENGDQALALARSHDGPIHLTITDMVMPGMRGTELARRLSTVRDESRILFISGYTDTSDLRRWTDTDPMVFLPKPFTPQALQERVHRRLHAPRRHVRFSAGGG